MNRHGIKNYIYYYLYQLSTYIQKYSAKLSTLTNSVSMLFHIPLCLKTDSWGYIEDYKTKKEQTNSRASLVAKNLAQAVDWARLY
jgi:hypothetical protein